MFFIPVYQGRGFRLLNRKPCIFLFSCALWIMTAHNICPQGWRGQSEAKEDSSMNNDARSAEARRLLNYRLNARERYVLEDKGTEPPFSGAYWDFKEEGTYHCRRCLAPLYRSLDKFESTCGWPSFDDEIPGSVTRQADADGRRTEILCSRCGGHLGHVFKGEGLTSKNTRHCVNSLSMRFVPSRGETGRAVFAGGCFWGVEALLQQQKGVRETSVGYTGGQVNYPAYQEVCSHKTGHVEAVEVLYDPDLISFRELAILFFEIHDPCQKDGQGPDKGNQYLSKIFYENESQKDTAKELMDILKSKGYDVATKLEPARAFWPAEEYHQDYYLNTGKVPYCHAWARKF